MMSHTRVNGRMSMVCLVASSCWQLGILKQSAFEVDNQKLNVNKCKPSDVANGRSEEGCKTNVLFVIPNQIRFAEFQLL